VLYTREAALSLTHMNEPVVYAYVDGYDLDACSEQISAACSRFVAEHVESAAWLVEQRDSEPPRNIEDLPRWDLGLNLPLARFSTDIAASLLGFLQQLAIETDREFVVGVAMHTGVAEDLATIDAAGGSAAARQFVLSYLPAKRLN